MLCRGAPALRMSVVWGHLRWAFLERHIGDEFPRSAAMVWSERAV